MTARQKTQAALAILCAVGALAASVAGLAAVASAVQMPGIPLPYLGGTIPIGAIGLILATDGLHVAAAYSAHGKDASWLSFVLLGVTTVISSALQAWAAPLVPGIDVVLVRGVHALPPVAMLGAVALAVRSVHPAKARRSAPAPERRSTRKEQGSALAAPPATPAPERPAAPPALADEVEIATWLRDQGRSPSQRSVKDAAQALGVRISSSGALALANQLKTPAPVPDHGDETR